jgi:hypothetical protein
MKTLTFEEYVNKKAQEGEEMDLYNLANEYAEYYHECMDDGIDEDTRDYLRSWRRLIR